MMRRLFTDEEPLIPQKPPKRKPMGKHHKRLAKIGSLLGGWVVWSLVDQTIDSDRQKSIRWMQERASEEGSPMTLRTTITVRDKITSALTGREGWENKVIINPPGQEPAIQVITPDVTITADDKGEIEAIIPKENTTEHPLTPAEARTTVDTALDALKKIPPADTQEAAPTPPEKK